MSSITQQDLLYAADCIEALADEAGAGARPDASDPVIAAERDRKYDLARRLRADKPTVHVQRGRRTYCGRRLADVAHVVTRGSTPWLASYRPCKACRRAMRGN
jgi:hypothetical protein